MLILAGYTFLLFSLFVAIFQLALAFGAPLGDYTLGGKYPGKVPSKIRLAALLQILILALFVVIVLTRSGIILEQFFRVSRIAIWFVAGFFILGSFVNLTSPSLKEKRLMGPINVLLLLLSIVIAIG
jgi:hypothetical protein